MRRPVAFLSLSEVHYCGPTNVAIIIASIREQSPKGAGTKTSFFITGSWHYTQRRYPKQVYIQHPRKVKATAIAILTWPVKIQELL